LHCLVILAALTACEDESSQTERFVPNRPAGSIVVDTVTGTFEGAWVAVQTPFEDINVKRQDIPEKLQQVSVNPYALPKRILCSYVREEIAELDTLLGPDLGPKQPSGSFLSVRKGEYVDEGATAAHDEAIHMVANRVNIIPFRGIVRNISGADKHAKAVERAYQAGRLRRAFLKGMEASMSSHCVEKAGKITAVSASAAPVSKTSSWSMPWKDRDQ
jgi:hypothetical protein